MSCVYLHINPLTNQPFYVGIGSEKRPYDKGERSKFWHSTVNKYGYIVDVIHDDLTPDQAKQEEVSIIKRFGRRDNGTGILVNLTDGGDGTFGAIVSKDTRVKLSAKKRGVKFSDEHKRKIGASKIGKPRSEETKNKLSKYWKVNGKTVNERWR